MFSFSLSNNKLIILVFTVTLLAFVVESQLTQYVQTTLNFRQPYFLFWIVHSSFIISLPCHLLYLTVATPYSLSALWKGLVIANSQHLNGANDCSSSRSPKFPLVKFIYLMLALTAAITMPALLWFAAIEMASVTDVTAIWNTNAFFAYIFSVKTFGLKWETRKLSAVVLATLGVLAVVYGGSTASSPKEPSSQSLPKSATPFIGDILTVIASIGYAGYQVFYKKYAALPSDPEFDDYQPISASEDVEVQARPTVPSSIDIGDAIYPPPFGLYSNFWTSAIGACTLVVLWVPIPFLHWFGVEPFFLPRNLTTLGAIAGIALTGSIFNAGFMITLALWGPIITSVGGLLTIVLVFFSDIILGATESLTIWTMLGSATIVVAFGVLAYDMLR